MFLLLPVGYGCKATHSVRTGRHSASKGKSQDIKVSVDLSRISGGRRSIVKEAEEWLGTPYNYGDHRKQEGSDCSGMVLSIYLATTGIKLPRNSAAQAEFCKRIGERDVLPGDLVFFATGKDPHKISHVGIMVNSEDFIHVSTSKGAVVSKTTTPYYTQRFICFGRVPGMGS